MGLIRIMTPSSQGDRNSHLHYSLGKLKADWSLDTGTKTHQGHALDLPPDYLISLE